MHATLETFGYPDSLVADYEYWCVLLRPAQVTLAALVLCAKPDVTRFADLPAEAQAEYGRVMVDIETVLGEFVAYDRINYLMLMMVDPHVHAHVIPRYAEPRTFEAVAFVDAGWPALPKLDAVTEVPAPVRQALRETLRSRWPVRS